MAELGSELTTTLAAAVEVLDDLDKKDLTELQLHFSNQQTIKPVLFRQITNLPISPNAKQKEIEAYTDYNQKLLENMEQHHACELTIEGIKAMAAGTMSDEFLITQGREAADSTGTRLKIGLRKSLGYDFELKPNFD